MVKCLLLPFYKLVYKHQKLVSELLDTASMDADKQERKTDEKIEAKIPLTNIPKMLWKYNRLIHQNLY